MEKGEEEKGRVRLCFKRQEGTPDGHTGEVPGKRVDYVVSSDIGWLL